MSSEGQGNDGSALVGDGTPASGLELGAALGQVPVSSRPPPPRKRTATLQGAAAPPVDEIPSMSPSADAPPSLDALDSALGFAQRAQTEDGAAAGKPGFAPVTASSGPSSSSRGPLSAPPAPPRPRAAPSAPPVAASGLSSADPASIGDGPPPIPDIDTPLAPGATRDSGSGTNASRRRSRRTLKIPDDAVPTTTPAPAAVAPSSGPASTPGSMPMPAVLSPPSSGSAPALTGTMQQAAAQAFSTAPAQPVHERAPIVTDDSIAIIRPMMIIAVGDSEPVIATPVPPPVAHAQATAPSEAPRPNDAETTQPAAPSPIAAARPAAPPRPAETTQPAVNLESTMPSAPSPLRSTSAQPPSPPAVTSQPPPAAAAQTPSAPVTSTPSVVEQSPALAPEAAIEANVPAASATTTEEIEPLEEIEPDRDSGPSLDAVAITKRGDEESLDDFEEADEIDPDRVSTTEEIPIVEIEVEQPKRPPPPPKREGPPSAPVTPPQPPTSAGPVSKPTAPASRPAPPTAKPETKKRPWWEEIFSEDFIRTMDQPKPSYVQREVNFIEESLGVEKGAVVLDLACGTGAHAVELASRGYSVVGFDLSLAMLARASDEAQERGQKLNFLQGDMREMAFEEMFDGIYCWSTSFGYFDEEKNIEVLARTHRALRHGGMLLIDLINRDFIAPRQPSLVWFEGDGCVCMDEMHVDFFTSRLKVKRTVMFEDGRTREVDYSIRVYNLHELGKMMHDVGFRVVQVTGQPAHPGVFFGSESPRIIILAERAD